MKFRIDPLKWNIPFKASLSISRIYWVLERDSKNPYSKHAPLLLECSEEVTQKQMKKALNVSGGHFGEIESTIGVSNYVTKFISSHNIEYEIVDPKS